MKKRVFIKKGVFISAGILILLLLVFYFISSSITKMTGFSVYNDDKFKECLKEKNIKLFVNSEDGNLENAGVSDYLDSVQIMNCFNNKKVCEVLEISDFPFWMIGGREIKGGITKKELAEFSGCG